MVESEKSIIETTPVPSSLVGEVLVVGVGVAGIQASLDLTRMGFHVTAIDKNKTIGGIMAQLDKTFPTNDCSLCILAPKMVEVYRNPSITLYQNTEIRDIEFLNDGNIKVTLVKKRMGIDESTCKNCGECYNVCPVRFKEDISWFDAGLNFRHATNIPFPSAVPPVYGIDRDKCLHVKYGICGKCQRACPAQCIDYDFTDQIIEVVVGGMIFATGASQMPPEKFPRFLGHHPDVLNGIQFERLLCASGPEGGNIIKPSTRQHAHRIAFIQCVGSRSKRDGELEYCSSVCCMYAMKEAQITKEHDPDVECLIFNTENRACFKGFHEYYLRAKNDYSVQFIQGRVSQVRQDPKSQDLIVYYENTKTGEIQSQPVDLVVLESALVPNTADIAKILGIKRNKDLYFDPDVLSELEKKGIFIAGYNIKPMDIPSSVVSGSAVAAKISRRLAAARFSRIVEKEFPPEKRVTPDDPARIGVMVCHCGINIGGIVDVERVAEEIKKEPNVVVAVHNYYSCSSDSQVLIKNLIRDNNLNRFIVASCTPRTHEPLFRVTLQEAGLNPYLFELVNIREHDSWVHMKQPDEATEKAIELLRMNIAKVRELQPQKRRKIDVLKSILIVGGGPAGLVAAENLSKQGIAVYLVEKEPELGGSVRKFSNGFLLPTERHLIDELKSIIDNIRNDDNIEIFNRSTIGDVSGFVGNYQVKILMDDGNDREIKVGGIIVATGVTQDADFSSVVDVGTPNIYNQDQFEDILNNKAIENLKSIVFIQCTNQRHDGMIRGEFPNCSGICCKITLKQAIAIHEINPEARIMIIHRGMQLGGDVQSERLLDRVQQFAMISKYSPDAYPEIKSIGSRLNVTYNDVNVGDRLSIDADAIVLATPYKSIPETRSLAMQL
ncbi:MAG: FAD-dependent oxidoreductase [Promethearchaeota archaeon]